jgi:hypothetical protein
MKKTTYGLPDSCEFCGNTDKTTFAGDWTGFDCRKCGKRNKYLILHVEEIPEVAETD